MSHITYGWIITNGQLITEKFNDYSNWFIDKAASAGIEIERIYNHQLLVTNDSEHPVLLPSSIKRKPQFIHFADKDLHLASQLEQCGYHLFNLAEAIKRCDDKSYMHRMLFQEKIATPTTILSPLVFSKMKMINHSFLKNVAHMIGFPMIIKESFGSFGEQVYWIENESDLQEKAQALAGIPHLYQKPVFTSIGKDIRLNVVGDKVVASMKRVSLHDFRANVSNGGRTEPYIPTKEEEELAIRATHAVKADFAGVDLLFGENGPVVCEVNSNPHIRSIYECTGIDIAPIMIDHIKKKLTS